MAGYRQATERYVGQIWLRSMSPHGVTGQKLLDAETYDASGC